jgi:capsular exopolysaccharide synthesis family protein
MLQLLAGPLLSLTSEEWVVNNTPSPLPIILKALLKWWWLIAISIALGAGVGYYVRSQQPDLFTSKATLLIGCDPRYCGSGSFVEENPLLPVYAELARRPIILETVIEDLELGLSADELNGMMEIRAIPSASLLEITITDTNAGRAATIANGVARGLINSSVTGGSQQEQEFIQQELRQIENQIDDLRAQHDEMVADAANLTSAFDIQQNLTERSTILSSIGELQTIYAGLAASLGSDAAQVSQFEPAVPNYNPSASGSMVSVVLAGAGGLVLSVVTVGFITFFDDRLRWQEGSAETVMGVKVLGPLGLVPRGKLPLYVVTMPDTIESEVVRQLRAKIVLAAGGVPPKVLTVSSYDSGDGKTVAASNMAVAAAQSGLRTVLIDGDMRKGDLHEIFRLPNVFGLSDILAAREEVEKTLSQSLLDSGYDNLTIVTSGRTMADPAALVSGPRLGRVIDILKRQFDFVVIDSVPTIGGPDTAFLAECSDGVVIVVHAQRTTQAAFRRTLQMLKEGHNIRIYGVVFNRIRLQVSSGYGYGYSYYRRTQGITAEALNKEPLNTKRRGLFSRPNISFNSQGERLYSLRACAVRLGTSTNTVEEWLRVGYLKAEKRRGRLWVKESEIDALLNRLPRQHIDLQPELGEKAHAATNGDGRGDTTDVTSLLREQRQALLDYVREPTPPDDGESKT